MEKEFIPYILALTLKELGFDEPCFGGLFKKSNEYYHYYFENQDICSRHFGNNNPLILAPLYQQVFKWFREKYGLHYIIHFNSKGYFATITKKVDIFTPCIFSSEIFNTYQEAELECLKKLIEIVRL